MENYTTLIQHHELDALMRDGPVPVIFDCRFDLAAPDSGAQGYAAGHLPGAQYLHLDRDLSGQKTGYNGRHPLPERSAFASLLARAGVNRDQQVVVYDAQGGIFAARAWWLLRWLGHSAVAVLDGGLQGWHAAGFALQTATVERALGNFEAAPPLIATVDRKTVQATVDGTLRLSVVDARAPDRFRGENETLDPRGGHIPGAINRFFKDNLDANGAFKPASLLRVEFQTLLGHSQANRSIQQCGSGVTACHNVLALAIAGLGEALLYPGSWSEWVSDPQAPLATG